MIVAVWELAKVVHLIAILEKVNPDKENISSSSHF